MKKRVTGLGGVFFKSHDPEAIKKWYQKHLDIQSGDHGALFHWRYSEDPEKEGATAWSPFPEDTDYYNPNGFLKSELDKLESGKIKRRNRLSGQRVGRVSV